MWPRAARRILAQVTPEWSRLWAPGPAGMVARAPAIPQCSEGSWLWDKHGGGGPCRLGDLAPTPSLIWRLPERKTCPQDQDLRPLSGCWGWETGPTLFCGPETALPFRPASVTENVPGPSPRQGLSLNKDCSFAGSSRSFLNRQGMKLVPPIPQVPGHPPSF